MRRFGGQTEGSGRVRRPRAGSQPALGSLGSLHQEGLPSIAGRGGAKRGASPSDSAARQRGDFGRSAAPGKRSVRRSEVRSRGFKDAGKGVPRVADAFLAEGAYRARSARIEFGRQAVLLPSLFCEGREG